ncbi:MAG: hypothetical protein IPK81_24820 [Rhodospirillales bacterium]|nr:MAG: hypothetical protein IPK81_24820 [Rhodospirillales bacterium]
MRAYIFMIGLCLALTTTDRAAGQPAELRPCGLEQYNDIEKAVLFEPERERALSIARDAIDLRLRMPTGVDSTVFIPLYRELPVFCLTDFDARVQRCSYLVYERAFRSTCESLVDRQRAFLLRFSVVGTGAPGQDTARDLSIEALGASRMPLWPGCQEWDLVCRNRHPRF